jgi:hypothetical protein
MPLVFKYNDFYKYYTDPSNLQQFTTPMQIFFYTPIDRYHDIWKLDSNFAYNFININNHQIYITSNNGWLFFNFPRTVSNKLMGDHISFGFKMDGKTIDMHFTFQNHVTGKAEHDSNKKCFLRDGMNIDDIMNLPCQQPNGGFLHEHFTSDEIVILTELLHKPFKIIATTGGNVKYRYKNHTYRIHKGARDGKYIVVKDKKIYVNI